jgi:hypothetical protein
LLRKLCKAHSDWRYTSGRQTRSGLSRFETRQGRWPCQRRWMSHPDILRNASTAPLRVCLPDCHSVHMCVKLVTLCRRLRVSAPANHPRRWLEICCTSLLHVGRGSMPPSHVVCLIIYLLPEGRTVVVSEWSGGIGTVTNCSSAKGAPDCKQKVSW